MNQRLLYLFTRTPLHVGAGASVGAIDQSVQRERHTGFPIIPGSALKGSFADQWPNSLTNEKDQQVRLTTEVKGDGPKKKTVIKEASAAAWLFGSDTTDLSFAGSLLFSEARLLAFPIRSAKGSYAWITCPLMLQRAHRDGVPCGGGFHPPSQTEPGDDQAIFKKDGPLALGDKVVLEEYCLSHTGEYPTAIAEALADLIKDDDLFKSISDRLVILSNGMMSHFVTTTCEVAQHVRISDETGTAEEGGLFNQENVPADALFYSVLSATKSRVPNGEFEDKPASDAFGEFERKIKETRVFQFGGDASTGLGFCSVAANSIRQADATTTQPA